MADEIKLTLGVPQAPNATEAVAEAAAEEQAVAQQVQADAAAKQVFSPESRRLIRGFFQTDRYSRQQPGVCLRRVRSAEHRAVF